ncbi:MAG: glycosyltransferase family 39 protein [Candidatus Colwellbacteria bacterium]|nr:glycosyltransferase family 39 protein [Candidatus Colwellbacteria bacterium]
MKREYWWLLLIIIIAAYLRLANITMLPPGLYPDEAMNGNNALEAIHNTDFSAKGGPAFGWKIFYPENNGREGLFINIQALFIKTLGNFPWVLRLPSAIFGILTVIGIYLLTRELFFKRNGVNITALLASFFAATSFWHINFSRIGFRAIMAPFFLVWGVYLLLLSLRQIKENKSAKFYILTSIFSGIIYGLGFYSYIAYRATPLLILILLTTLLLNMGGERKKALSLIAAFVGATIIVSTPLSLYFLKNPQDFLGRTTQISVFNSEAPLRDLSLNIVKTAGMFNFVGDGNWRHNIAGKPELFWPVGILFLIGVVIGFIPIFRNQTTKNNFSNHLGFIGNFNFGFWILFAWLIVAAAPVVVSNEGVPHALRAILMAPAVFIIAAMGGAKIYEYLNGKIKNYVLETVSIAILVTITFEAYASYFIEWGKNPNVFDAFSGSYAAIARELNSLPNEKQKVVIVNASGVDVRGTPMPAQTVMFLTDTFREEERIAKNIKYLTPDNLNQIKEAQEKEAFIIYLN